MARSPKKGLILGDRRTHAVQLRLLVPRAMCGAGRISLTLPDRFDAEEQTACPDCVNILRSRVR